MGRYSAKIRNYFYGFKVQLLTTKDGISIAFHFTPRKTSDAKAIEKMIDKLPAEASLHGYSAYTDYSIEDIAFEKNVFFENLTQIKC